MASFNTSGRHLERQVILGSQDQLPGPELPVHRLLIAERNLNIATAHRRHHHLNIIRAFIGHIAKMNTRGVCGHAHRRVLIRVENFAAVFLGNSMPG